MADFTTLLERTRDAIANLEDQCIACGTCTTRCDLLESRAWNIRTICEETNDAIDGAHDAQSAREGIDAHPSLYQFLRSCESCNRCTVHCPQQLNMSDLWQPWRALLRRAQYIPDSDVGMIKTDCTWNTFSVYRHVWNIDYSDLSLLEVPSIDETEGASVQEAAASKAHAETLFFPGCTLCTYAPELTRAAYAWLNEHVGSTLLATQCCAWPLECAGEVDRAQAWRERVIAAAKDQGVRRIVGVCPGCDRQLEIAAAAVAPGMEFVPLAQLLRDAGIRLNDESLADCTLPLSVATSCNDRASIHGPAVRALFEHANAKPFPCADEDAWCCGAGGAVNAYDPNLARSRTCRSFRLCEQAGAHTLVTVCPTCAYTYAFERWMQAQEGNARWDGMGSLNYLEVAFDMRINWPRVFANLTNMWQGERGAWVAEQLSQSEPGSKS